MDRPARPSNDRAESPGDADREVSFATDQAGLTVTDHIERQQFRLLTPDPVVAEPADTTHFWFPTDAATKIRTPEITLPNVVVTYVRDDEGEMLAEADQLAHEEFGPGTYSVELCAPMKVYLRVDGPLTVSSDLSQTSLDFDGETTVLVGARSHHERPAGTVTTTAAPTDVMAAVSTFASALKTTSVERSYPTLRGHPPLVELGEELDVPSRVRPPETGVHIEVPETLEHAFVAAPLSYYLGARIVPGEVPRVVTDAGFEHRLDAVDGFEHEVARVLKQVFFLDCVTRTEGYYEVDLHERRAIESAVDLDFADLYGRSLADQFEAYLSVPHATVEPHLPEWKLTSHVDATPENVELLPFLTNDLAVVRTPTDPDVSTSAAQSAAAEEFFRDDFTRSAAAEGTSRSYVQPDDTDSVEQSWVGDGAPIGASKASTAAYRNRLDRSPTDGNIDITVVCNDPEMAAESDVVDDVYGTREELPFEATLHRRLSCAELADVLKRQTDFLHYIGHIDHEGFQCSDGKLDATRLDSVGADAFLLNACSSYEQGSGLVEAGGIAGIVTLSDVVNSGAVRMGRMLARLLNQGFGIQNALDIARDESAVGQQYTVVGDGGLAIAQTVGGAPNVCSLERLDDDRFELTYRTYVSQGMGDLVIPFVGDDDRYYLASGTAEEFELSRSELAEFLSLEAVPVRYDGKLEWSDELTVGDL
jgi:hypothetical protein